MPAMYTINVGLAFIIFVLGTAFILTVSRQVILCHHKNATTNRIQIIIYLKSYMLFHQQTYWLSTFNLQLVHLDINTFHRVKRISQVL